MREERRAELRRAYLRLGTGELAAAGVFAVLAGVVATPRLDGREDAALWSALVPLLVVLVQAGVYWLLACGWVGRAPMPSPLAECYRAFRALDAGLLVVGLLGVLVRMPDDIGVALAVGAVWAFGVVEYVNYFVVRLAYPARRWWFVVGELRAPRLVQDVSAARGARVGAGRG